VSEPVTMTMGATYEVLDINHPCTLWRGKLTVADCIEDYCRLDFGQGVTAVFTFADPRLSLVALPALEADS